MPYWAIRLACLRLVTRRIAGLSIGAGPLGHPSSRVFARLAVKTLNPCSVRDPLALGVLQPLSGKDIQVVPDPAFMLQATADTAAMQALLDAGVPAGKNLVGVSLRRWFHTRSNLVPHKYAARLGFGRTRGQAMMSAFTNSVAGVLTDLVTQTNAHILFMPTYNVRHENDAAVCREIAGKLPPGSHSSLCIDDPKLYKAVAGQLSVMLCGRMHPAILAAGQGTPVVGLAYNQKFFGMFSLIGQQARCLSMTDFVTNDESARLTAMLREAIDRPTRFRPDTAILAKVTAKFISDLITTSTTLHADDAEPQTLHR
jgi:polysaccharide pyruvyl transferase WcaK-like protein